MTVSRTFECDAAAPGQARAWAAEVLTAVPVPSGEVAEDAVLCVSELVTNAVQASCDRLSIDVVVEPEQLRISVTDNGRGWPEIRNPQPGDRNGRGLVIVDVLSRRWGVVATGSRKCVWAEFALRS